MDNFDNMENKTIQPAKYRGRADIHIHSASGDGLATVEQILEYVNNHTNLDLIAITDHDELKGSFKARDLVAQKNYRVQVLVGCEITTRNGHLLVYDIENHIPMLQTMEATVEAVHKQNGFCIVPHPLSWLTLSAGNRVMERIINSPSPDIYFDGVEVFNPSIAGRPGYYKRDISTAINGIYLKQAEVMPTRFTLSAQE